MGPWNPYLHERKIGKATWILTEAINQMATLPRAVREIAILVVGARYKASFAIYAHVAVGQSLGISLEHLATISATLKPTDFANDESVAYDIAHSLCAARAAVSIGGYYLRSTRHERDDLHRRPLQHDNNYFERV